MQEFCREVVVEGQVRSCGAGAFDFLDSLDLCIYIYIFVACVVGFVS